MRLTRRRSSHTPLAAAIPGVVTHVFTHFPLDLVVYVTQIPLNTRTPKSARWVALADLGDEALPNLMRKVVAHALETGARTECYVLGCHHKEMPTGEGHHGDQQADYAGGCNGRRSDDIDRTGLRGLGGKHTLS